MPDLLETSIPPTRLAPSLGALPDRDLTGTELRDLVAALAADPDAWAGTVDHGADEARHYVQLHRDTHVDVWLICWNPSNDTGWHDHDISSGAVAVVSGALTEHVLSVGGPHRSHDLDAGHTVDFGPDHIHRLVGRDPGSVSIHAYSPPLWRMGQYAISPSGVLRRSSVSYADELRPLDGSAA